jgi:polyphosphate kinase
MMKLENEAVPERTLAPVFDVIAQIINFLFQPTCHTKKSYTNPSRIFFFFDRDLSWLFFNGRVLMEAEKESVPLLERINFLSIFSSNLDEFYRVRMPALAALHKLYKKQKVEEAEASRHADVVKTAKK